MSNGIKVGSRVRDNGGPEGTVKDLDVNIIGRTSACVKWDNGNYNMNPLEVLTLIPDTVTIELSRETVEYYGGQLLGKLLGSDRHFDELIQVCRKALGMGDV